MTSPPQILTPRLSLSALRLADAPRMFAYRNDAEVSRYQGFTPATLDEVVRFVARNERTEFGEEDTWFQHGIRLRSDSRLIGDMGLHFVGDRQLEVGFSVAPEYQGRGYGTEAVRGVVRFAFDELGLHRIFASIDPRNEPSGALLRRVGLRQEAHHRQSLWFKGEWVDDVIFALLRSEWLENLERTWIRIQIRPS